jgi:hypothetical protein
LFFVVGVHRQNDDAHRAHSYNSSDANLDRVDCPEDVVRSCGVTSFGALLVAGVNVSPSGFGICLFLFPLLDQLRSTKTRQSSWIGRSVG